MYFHWMWASLGRALNTYLLSQREIEKYEMTERSRLAPTRTYQGIRIASLSQPLGARFSHHKPF